MAEISLKNVSTGLTVNGRYYSVADLKNATLKIGEDGEQGGDGEEDEETPDYPDVPTWTLWNPVEGRNEKIVFEPAQQDCVAFGEWMVSLTPAQQYYSNTKDVTLTALVSQPLDMDYDDLARLEEEEVDFMLEFYGECFRNLTSGKTYDMERLSKYMFRASEIASLGRGYHELEFEVQPSVMMESLSQDTPMIVVLRITLN